MPNPRTKTIRTEIITLDLLISTLFAFRTLIYFFGPACRLIPFCAAALLLL